MLASILVATSPTIALFLGLAHIYLTFFTRAFAARDAALEEKLKSVSPRISGQTTMWRAGVGFHVSHALGVIFFGLVYGYWALAKRLPHSGALLGRAGRFRSARLCRPGEALLVLSAIGRCSTRANLLRRRRCRCICMTEERPQFGAGFASSVYDLRDRRPCKSLRQCIPTYKSHCSENQHLHHYC